MKKRSPIVRAGLAAAAVLAALAVLVPAVAGAAKSSNKALVAAQARWAICAAATCAVAIAHADPLAYSSHSAQNATPPGDAGSSCASTASVWRR